MKKRITSVIRTFFVILRPQAEESYLQPEKILRFAQDDRSVQYLDGSARDGTYNAE